MKKFLLIAAASLTLAATVSANAQVYFARRSERRWRQGRRSRLRLASSALARQLRL